MWAGRSGWLLWNGWFFEMLSLVNYARYMTVDGAWSIWHVICVVRYTQ